MASKRELEALIVLAGKVDPSLQKAIRSAEKSTKSLSGEASKLGKLSDKAFSIMAKGVAIGATAIGVAMVATAKKGLMLASDLNEVQNVVDVTFGKDAQKINDWSQTALKSFGLSELSAKRYSSTLGAMMKSSGISSEHLVSMSENLTALSGDFASFYNLDPADAFEKIQSGISGETEPLKQLGINMNVANLQAFALSKGIKTAYDKMSQADQTILRYNYLLEKSADAQGDFARTQNGFANQQRLLGESFKQFAAKIMSSTLPAFTSLMKKGNELIDSFANDPKKMATLQETIGKVVDKVIAAIPTAISIATDFGNVLGIIFNVAMDVFKVIHDNWSIVEPMILGIVGALTLWKAATIAMKAYEGFMVAVKVATAIATGIQWLFNAAVAANPMTWIIAGVVAAVGLLVAGIVWLWNNWSAVTDWIVGLWQNNVLPFFQGIGNFFVGIWDGIVGGFQAAWGGVTSWFKDLWDGIVGVFKGFVNLIIDGLNFFVRALNMISFDIPDWVPVIGGMHFGFDIPEIPKFAQGGFANQPSIFGEAGPEAAIPLRRTPRSLSILNKTADILGVGGGAGGGSPTFVFAPVYGGSGGASDLKSAFEDFKAQCDEWWESKRRESFA